MFNLSSKFQKFKGKRKGKIWQLFRATDFVSLMYPCFWFCRILGIFPYKINASTIKTCKPRYILSTIIICVFCILELINLYDVNKNYAIERYGILSLLERNFFYIVGGFTVVTTFILSGPRMRFLQTLLELSLKLPPKSYQNLSRLIHAKDIIGFLFIVVRMSIYFSGLPSISVLCKFLMLYIFLLEFIMDMLYINCVCIVKACFKQINDNLMNLRELVTNSEPYLLSGTYHEQRSAFILIDIISLKRQHLAISGAVKTLKMVFSLHILSTILMTFNEIIFNLYYYLMNIHGGIPMNNLQKLSFYEACITAVTYYSVKMVLIVWACETGKNRAVEIKSTVHDVFNSTNNKQIKYEMRLFSLQISHCENTFSAKGLTVDAALLTKMAGSITTYLVIFIQFLFTSNSCDK